MTAPITSPECCPRLDPAAWDNKFFDWQNKKFIKDKVLTFFYMPLNFGGVMTRLTAKVEKAGAFSPDNLCLSYHPSKWKMDVYLAVDRDIPSADNVAISGRFYCRVYQGDFRQTGEWGKDFAAKLSSQGLKADQIYMWYTTCPKCAKKYGKNYVAFLGRIT